MIEAKPWYQSKTILASLISIGAAFAGLAGVPVEPDDGSALADCLIEGIAAIAGIAAILGRMKAKRRIG